MKGFMKTSNNIIIINGVREQTIRFKDDIARIRNNGEELQDEQNHRFNRLNKILKDKCNMTITEKKVIKCSKYLRYCRNYKNCRRLKYFWSVES